MYFMFSVFQIPALAVCWLIIKGASLLEAMHDPFIQHRPLIVICGIIIFSIILGYKCWKSAIARCK